LEDGPINLADPYIAFIRTVADGIPNSSKVLEKIRTEELPSLLQARDWRRHCNDCVTGGAGSGCNCWIWQLTDERWDTTHGSP